jgi:mRNA interferase RelE/StbE
MIIFRTDSFKKDFKKLPDEIKRRTEKALILLIDNPNHPSLQIKKTKGKIIKGHDNVFEGRITKNYRFLFLTERGVFVLLCCGTHDEFFK